MKSILRHSAIALVAASLLTSGLVAYALDQGMGPIVILALAFVGGTAIGTCITGSVYAILGMRHECMAETIGTHLARGLATQQKHGAHAGMAVRRPFTVVETGEAPRMARAA